MLELFVLTYLVEASLFSVLVVLLVGSLIHAYNRTHKHTGLSDRSFGRINSST